MNSIERLLVVGDIHGNWEKFKSLYDKIGFDPEKDLIVFLGDYLDRGDEPVPVMEWVMEHYGQKNMIFLRGNHEQMFYDAVLDLQVNENNRSIGLWLSNGGNTTCEGIKNSGKSNELISNWLNLVAKLPLYTEIIINDKTYWFMHANCNPNLPISKQTEGDLLWNRTLAQMPKLHNGEQTIVLGHTPVQFLGLEAKPQWFQNGKLVLMDTGSFLEEGKISCADLLSGKIYQSDM